MNTEQDKAARALEEIAQSWDGCMYDDVGHSIDIGEDLRKQFAALQSAVTPAANAGDNDPWQHISTAPREELLLLAAEFDFPGDWRIKVGGYWNGQWNVFGASWTPTRWMPLPAVPGASRPSPAVG
jgi:hypothetical protein